MTESDSVYDEQ